jgi:hypothetical protein
MWVTPDRFPRGYTMKKFLGAVAALTLSLCGTASAGTIPVMQLSGQFAGTNPSVASTNDGVQFGVYADGGSTGGSLFYSGANGLTLNQITALAFTERHNTTDDSPIAAPYLRIFLDGDAHDIIFDATQCATTVPAENTANHFNVVGNDARYDDDGCDGVPPDQQHWTDVLAAHGSEVVSGIYISAGFTGGADLSALVTDLTVNANTFCFNCPQPTPAPIVTNTFVTEPPTVNAAASKTSETCKGNVLRTLHAPRRAGQRFLSVRATLRGKRLHVNGRAITTDLRKQPEANYNVRLTIRYRTHSGKVVTVKTTRNLSVVCA